ncbi:MAG: segregation and condensation protein [uncultured bacterium]|nr:MAG: segregation and condensation protein [uncultured bacterium]
MANLQSTYQDRGVELVEVASGYRFQAKSDSAPFIQRLDERKALRYSRAFLETLALIAYRQPITRGEIEDVRGVAVNPNIIRTLMERDWIKIAGYRDVPGKPALFATTKTFLDHFNLKKISELPPLSELVDYEALEKQLGLQSSNDNINEDTDTSDKNTLDLDTNDKNTLDLDTSDKNTLDLDTSGSECINEDLTRV